MRSRTTRRASRGTGSPRDMLPDWSLRCSDCRQLAAGAPACERLASGDATHDHLHDPAGPFGGGRTAFSILAALSLCHLLNDTIQSLLPAIYPVLQENYALSFTQIGFLHFVFQFTASLLAAGRRALHRQAADVPPLHRRHGGEPDRPPHPRLRQPLLGAARRGDVHRHRLVDLPPRQLAGRPHRLGRPLRLRAVASSRWAATPAARSGRCSPPTSCCRFGQHAIAWFSALALLGMILLWNVGTWARARHREARGDRAAPRRRPRLRLPAAQGRRDHRRARARSSSPSTSTSRA